MHLVLGGSDNDNSNDNNVNIDDNTSSLKCIKYLLTESWVWSCYSHLKLKKLLVRKVKDLAQIDYDVRKVSHIRFM